MQKNISDRAATVASCVQDGEWGDEEDLPLPSDVEACIASLRNELLAHAAAKGLTVPPLVLLTQLCSLIKDRTQLDRELDSLQHLNAIRVFKLATGAVACMHTVTHMACTMQNARHEACMLYMESLHHVGQC